LNRSRSSANLRASLLRWSLLLLAGLLLPWIAEQRPEVVESLYSKALFPGIAAILGWLGALVPFSIAQLAVSLLILGLVLSLFTLLRRLIRRDRKGLSMWLRGTLIVLAIGVWSFEILWGLQYARPALADRLQLSQVEPTVERLASLMRWLARDANHSYAMAVLTGEIGTAAKSSDSGDTGSRDSGDTGSRESGDTGDRLATREAHAAPTPSDSSASTGFLVAEEVMIAALARAYGSIEPNLGNVRFSPPKQPKVAGEMLSRFGISGIYFPFTGEATVNALLPSPSFPFTAAHEMAHQRGIAREDEANFLAFLTCREAGLWCTRYGGSLGAYLRVRRALWKAEPDSVRAMGELLAAGPQEDVERIVDFWARYEGPATAVAEQVNDTYLKANRQMEGVASYDQMVRILVAFQEDGLLDPSSGPSRSR
jgi:hypothetical protein